MKSIIANLGISYYDVYPIFMIAHINNIYSVHGLIITFFYLTIQEDNYFIKQMGIVCRDILDIL